MTLPRVHPAVRTVEARATREFDTWLIETVEIPRVRVHVASLANVEAAVNRALAARRQGPHAPIRIHIYWYR